MVAARAALVTTLATIANGRGRVTGTLRAVALAHGGLPAGSTGETPPQRPHAKRRDLPERRAAQYEDNWREVYGQTALDILLRKVKLAALWIVIAFVVVLLTRGAGVAFLLLAGIALVLLVAWLATSQDTIVCTPAGFTVERGTPFQQPTRRTYRWEEIAATGYVALSPAEERAGKGMPTSQGHFFVHVGPEIVFDRHSTLPPGQFDQLVERFSWMTPHLPYEWIPTPDGRFRKVSRERLRDGV